MNELKIPQKKDYINNDDISKNIMVKIISECLKKNINQRGDINSLLKIVKGETKINI